MKIYEIKFSAYEMSEDDGGGMRSYVRGYTHDINVANKWKGKNGYRSVYLKEIHHKYVVSESMADEENVKKQALIDSAMKKLTKEELDALLSSIQTA